MTDQELQHLVIEYTDSIIAPFEMPNSIPSVITISKENVKKAFADMYVPFLRWLSKTHCIVSREFVKRERLVIEFDKKQMLEKPIGEKIALAGVYQAKLELYNRPR